MRIIANDIKAGNILEYKGKLYIVSKTPTWAMPGKGGAFVQVEMKEIVTGTKINERFRSTEEVEKVRLDQKEYTYLYTEDDKITFMDKETYEQLIIDQNILGEKVAFLKEGMEVVIESHDEKALNVILPDTVILTVIEADSVIKGQTVSSSYKPAKLENGLRIMVPPFIESGTKIIVKTSDLTYVERAK
ncbi:Elongation factor P [Rickettsiales bacterium Ac37b]|nr:Elongation factor P [Rickettsiales bacterium Ac37b]